MYARFRSSGITLLVAFALFFPSNAFAQLQFTLTNPTQSGTLGQTLSFSGTLTNTGNTTLFLNGDPFTLSGTGLTLNDDPFLTAPLFLTGGAVYSGQFFTVAVASNAPAQTASGSFTITGGPNGTSQNTLATQSFQVNVVAPEPGTGSLLLFAMVSMGLGLASRQILISSRQGHLGTH